MLEILISREEKERKIALLENGKLVEYYVDEEETTRKEGNIYIGVVKDIVKGMQAAFVDIGTEKNSFIHLKDILDKVDESKEEIKNDVDISDVIKVGEKLLVQVKKDSNLQKGARVSTHINLPSKYIALMPNTEIVTVSQKITDKQEQQRLIKLVKENLSEGNGAIIRTSAEGKEKEIIDDIKNIEKKWNYIKEEFEKYKVNKPKLISKSENIIQKMIIDLPEKSIQRIITNDKQEYSKILNFKNENNYLKDISIEFKENNDILDIYDVKKEILKLRDKLEVEGYTLVPLKIYFVKNKAKVLIGVAKGKKNYNKKETIKERDIKREMERNFKYR